MKQYIKKLLVFLVGIALPLILVVLLFPQNKQVNRKISQTSPTPPNKKISTQIPTNSILSFQPQSANSIAVLIDTGNLAASAVQLEIGYDPKMIYALTIEQGDFFQDPVILSNKIDQQNGKLLYEIEAGPGVSGKQGKGTIATISYSLAQDVRDPMHLHFLPGTKITALGIDDSVLKNTSTQSLFPGH